MSSKKETVKRLIIFCILAYLPVYVMTPILNTVFGEPIFGTTENTQILTAVQFFGTLGMFAPAIAHLLTRLLTREGFKDHYLLPNFDGNAKYYALSVLVKLAEAWVSLMIIWLVFLKTPFGETFTAGEGGDRFAVLLSRVASSVIVFFPAFGEEWGWRGYMMPKLFELMPKPAAIIVGGLIWGLWHAPLTVSGHNFGLDYPGFPWLGILMMCVLCILENAFLTLLTEKTKSIYPAAFCHMVNNNCPTYFMLSIFGTEAVIEKANEIPSMQPFYLMLAVTAVTASVSFVLLIKKDKAPNK